MQPNAIRNLPGVRLILLDVPSNDAAYRTGGRRNRTDAGPLPGAYNRLIHT